MRAGTMSIHERVRWLSSVCEVMTEPSTVAVRPQVMEVQPSGKPPSQSGLSWAEVNNGVAKSNVAVIRNLKVFIVKLVVFYRWAQM